MESGLFDMWDYAKKNGKTTGAWLVIYRIYPAEER